MTDNEIISQASKEQFNVACDATDASKNILSEASVIKALECCFLSECDCKDCPYSDLEICDTAKMINIVIDLINRQKAEIERLNDKYKCLEASSLIFKGGVDYFVKEAIKAFAERLKGEYAGFDELHEEIGYDNLMCAIDNLVAEMTEQKNEGKE